MHLGTPKSREGLVINRGRGSKALISQFFIQQVVCLLAADSPLFCDRFESFVSRQAGFLHFGFQMLFQRAGPLSDGWSRAAALDNQSDLALYPGARTEDVEKLRKRAVQEFLMNLG